jgi:hypothetical protein
LKKLKLYNIIGAVYIALCQGGFDMNNEKLAKIIRILTIPPVMALVLFIVLFQFKESVFENLPDFIAGVLLLVFIPALAYPLQFVIPSLKKQGRDGQRKLAFIMSLVSYSGMLFYGILEKVSKDMLFICLTYFLTVIILTICNKLLHIKASGHAASCTSPLLFFIFYFSWPLFLPCFIIFLMILWASLITKRHNCKEFLTGAVICIISFIISLGLTYI